MDSGGGSRRHGSHTHFARFQIDAHFHCRIASRVENFSALYGFDRAHVCFSFESEISKLVPSTSAACGRPMISSTVGATSAKTPPSRKRAPSSSECIPGTNTNGTGKLMVCDVNGPPCS